MGIMTTYPKDFCLFSAPDDPEMLEEAREYCRQNNLTAADVKIGRATVQDMKTILVLTKREVCLG